MVLRATYLCGLWQTYPNLTEEDLADLAGPHSGSPLPLHCLCLSLKILTLFLFLPSDGWLIFKKIEELATFILLGFIQF